MTAAAAAAAGAAAAAAAVGIGVLAVPGLRRFTTAGTGPSGFWAAPCFSASTKAFPAGRALGAIYILVLHCEEGPLKQSRKVQQRTANVTATDFLPSSAHGLEQQHNTISGGRRQESMYVVLRALFSPH